MRINLLDIYWKLLIFEIFIKLHERVSERETLKRPKVS